MSEEGPIRSTNYEHMLTKRELIPSQKQVAEKMQIIHKTI